MQLQGRRKSSNVEDRRSSGAMLGGGIGLGGIIIVGIILLLTGQDPTQILNYVEDGTTQTGEYVESEQDRELFDFASTILAGTEDVWSEIFKRNGLTYTPPKLVIFNGSVQSGCGGATSQSGPFYCSADQSVYLDLSFFKSMKQQLGADGDFAWAYVIAHEVGHHVQYLLGTLDQVNQKRQRCSEKEANQLTVRLELQADFYAGIWAYHDNKNFKSLEAGDLDAQSPILLPTARQSSAPAGSRKVSPPAIPLWETPSRPDIQIFNRLKANEKKATFRLPFYICTHGCEPYAGAQFLKATNPLFQRQLRFS